MQLERVTKEKWLEDGPDSAMHAQRKPKSEHLKNSAGQGAAILGGGSVFVTFRKGRDGVLPSQGGRIFVTIANGEIAGSSSTKGIGRQTAMAVRIRNGGSR